MYQRFVEVSFNVLSGFPACILELHQVAGQSVQSFDEELDVQPAAGEEVSLQITVCS